ncbi:MAG: YeeE/YedE thiosulfate transporter family protein [Motiliproteus sp.]
MTIFLVVLLCIGLIGYLAQTTGLCMVRGVNEAVTGKPLFLLAILFSGVFSWVSVLSAQLLDLPIPFASYEVGLWAVFGGFLFGLGAALNNGCGVSTISKLARGQLGMLATVSGWLLGWLLLTLWAPERRALEIAIPEEIHYGILVVLSILIMIGLVFLSPSNRKIWLGMLTIGLLAGFAFLYEPKWTPSGLLKDISYSTWNGDHAIWPSTERFLIIIALIAGMIIAAVRTRSFVFNIPRWHVFVMHLFAGVLMGIGAAIASGGNDSQLLLALPALSPAGLVTVLAMLGGIYAGRKINML